MKRQSLLARNFEFSVATSVTISDGNTTLIIRPHGWFSFIANPEILLFPVYINIPINLDIKYAIRFIETININVKKIMTNKKQYFLLKSDKQHYKLCGYLILSNL